MAGWAIWGGLWLLLLLLALHPFTTYPLSLRLFARRRPVPARMSGARPTISICMSAYNEARVIVAKVERLIELAAAYGPARIHVYVDGASDGTDVLLRPYADRIDLHVSHERLGKTAGLNQLVRASKGELILFTDANVMVREGSLDDIAAPFGDRSIGCASAKLEYTNGDETATSSAGATYWQLEERIKRLESETFGVIGVDGAFFMIRRSAYRAAPEHLIDDLFVSLKVLIQGLRVVSVPRLRVLERSASGMREEMARKARIACQAINVNRALRPELRRMKLPLRYAYVSHRILKWATPFTLAGSAICLEAALVAAFGPALLLVPVVGILLVIVGSALHIRPFEIVASILYSLAGVAKGVIEGLLTNQTYTIWTPASSVREPSPGTDG